MAYTKKMRKYAEKLQGEEQWQVEAVNTLPLTISATGVTPHTLHHVLK